MLLGQRTTSDSEADLCASRNYYDTASAHGGRVQVVRVDPADEDCYCIGNPNNVRYLGVFVEPLHRPLSAPQIITDCVCFVSPCVCACVCVCVCMCVCVCVFGVAVQ